MHNNRNKFFETIMELNEKELRYRNHPEESLAFYQSLKAEKPVDTNVYTLPAYLLKERNAHGMIHSKFNIVPVLENIAFNKQTRYSVVPLHRHEYIEMNYVYNGDCTTIIDGREIPLQKGDVCIMNVGVVHTILPTQEQDLLLNCLLNKKYFTLSFFKRLSNGGPVAQFLSDAIGESQEHDQYLLIHTSHSQIFHTMIENVFCEYLDSDICAADAIDSYMNLIFIELARCYQDDKETEYRRNKKSYLTEILQYMEDHCTDCTLKSTAEHFGFHPNYLSRMIRQATKSNFKTVITDGRLSRAAMLLRTTDLPIQEIAIQCGYTNQSFFYRKFQERYHCSPKQYRKQNNIGEGACQYSV